MNSILLFTNNLRIEDNLTLQKAFLESEKILPIFIFDEELLKETKFHIPRFSIHRKNVLIEALEDLEKNLSSISLNLYKFFGNRISILEKLIFENKIEKIYLQKEFAYEEIKFETEIKIKFPNIKLELVQDGSLIHLDDLQIEIINLPDVFSSFRSKVEKNLYIRKPISIPNKIPIQIKLDYKENNFFEKENYNKNKNSVFSFEATEKEVKVHLENYIWKEQKISTYKETRNGLVGKDYSTKFSTFLTLGLISARTIHYEVKKFEEEVLKNESTYWVIFELLWRDYFRFQFIKHKEKFFYKTGIGNILKNTNLDFERFKIWKEAKTNSDFINANMIELNETGFMSNRGRQNVASFLVNDLKVDYRLGAEYFESKLIDYDVYSNYGNWAYIAGVGNDPRKDRYFNPEKQANMYDSDCKFRNIWLKNLE